MPVRERSVSFVDSNDLPAGAELGPGRILFRGDTRNAYTIFSQGFSRRSDDEDEGVIYRQLLTQPDAEGRVYVKGAGDLRPDTAVCMSARLSAATMFPLSPATDTNIFAVFVEQQCLIWTHTLQVLDAMAAMKVGDSIETAVYAFDNCLAEEFGTMRVPGCQVIAALKCRRAWRAGTDYASGATYTLLGPLRENPTCTLPASIKDPAIAFLRTELASYAAGSTPDYRTTVRRASWGGADISGYLGPVGSRTEVT